MTKFKRKYATRCPGAHLSVEWFILEIGTSVISPLPSLGKTSGQAGQAEHPASGQCDPTGRS